MKIVLDHGMVYSILEKMGGTRIKALGALSFEVLYRRLSKREMDFVENFLKLNPKDFGFVGEFFGIDSMPKNLMTIKGQIIILDSRKKRIENQYLPLPVWIAYGKANMALGRETGKKLLVYSGHRSPACQLLTFLYYFKSYEFDFAKTVESIAFPGYSEHQVGAVDFVTKDGIASDEKPDGFEKTIEFKWLSKNANKFGFALSYPENNSHGIKFEPWHWRYEGV